MVQFGILKHFNDKSRKNLKRFQRELKYGKFINLPIVSVISDLMFSEDVKFPECKRKEGLDRQDIKVTDKQASRLAFAELLY